MNWRRQKWKKREKTKLPQLTFTKAVDRVMFTDPPLRRLKFVSSVYDISITLDNGEVILSGTSKEYTTPSFTGLRRKNKKNLEISFSYLPLIEKEELREVIDGTMKAEAVTVWLERKIDELLKEEKASRGN